MQSPTIIAGLRRVATSLWLHFVASPQRVPVFGYRRRGRTVVNVIYRLPPSRRMLPPRWDLADATSGEHRAAWHSAPARIAPPLSRLRAPM